MTNVLRVTLAVGTVLGLAMTAGCATAPASEGLAEARAHDPVRRAEYRQQVRAYQALRAQ